MTVVAEKTRRPKSHAKQHTAEEEKKMRETFSEMYHAAKRIELGGGARKRKRVRKEMRKYREPTTSAEKVQVDTNEVSLCEKLLT